MTTDNQLDAVEQISEPVVATGRRRRRAHGAGSASAPGAGPLFVLHRDQDVTGVSGTGAVAEGVRFFDGTVVMRWTGEHASTVVWPDLDTALAVHGHDGRTRPVFVDEHPPGEVDRARLGAANRRRGADAERKLATWLRAHGWPGAERAVRTGYATGARSVTDPGDITGTPSIVWQVKDQARESVEAWLAETEQQRLGGPGARPADLGLLVVRRRGKADVGRWWVWLPVEQFAALVAGTRWRVGSRPIRIELADVVPLLRASGYGEPLGGDT